MEVFMTALRGVAARVARLQRCLGEREKAVLGSLQHLRLLTTDQIRRLHVVDGSSHTQARRTRSLLRRLADLGVVVRLSRDIGGTWAGSGTASFCLSGLGQAVLDAPTLGARRRRTLWRTKPYFQDHMLAVAELLVQLTEVCRRSASELLLFEAEPACWRRFPGRGGETIVLKPDAYLRIGSGDYELAWFVEVDLATESLPTIQRKCRLFVEYWRSGLEQQLRGVFPRVVWLVPDHRRLEGVATALRRLPNQEAQKLFTVCLNEHGSAILTTVPEGGDGGRA
jgi:hypothetical protein